MKGTIFMEQSHARRQSHGSIDELLFTIDQAYNKKAWHGTNLRGSIRGITAKQAAWRPGSGRHNIREIVLHCAYWKYIVRRRILREKRGSFPLKGSNWFGGENEFSEQTWREDIRLLDQCHRSLVEAVSGISGQDLPKTPVGSKVNNLAIIVGIASHDLYHAGQIQLLKRLSR